MIGTITDLAPQVAAGTATAVGLLRQCLRAIAADNRVGRHLGAILSLNPAAASEATALDGEWRRSGARGPLHGIPIVIKDNIDVFGLPTTSGSVALASAMPRCDAEQVRRLRAAGAVIVGKANMAELSFEVRSRSSLGGDVRNPLDSEVTAGGSSGGTAAAVAAGFAVAGLGTDTGGSIRIPASFTGLVGVRPTHASLDMRGIAPLAPGADTVGPIARCTADAVLMLAIMSGKSPPVSRYRHAIRLGVVRQTMIGGEATALCDAALKRFAASGAAELIDVCIPVEMIPDYAIDAIDLQFRWAFDAYLANNFVGGAPASLAEIVDQDAVLPDCRAVLQRRAAADADAPALTRYRDSADRLAKLLEGTLADEKLDALIYPTSAVVPTSLDNPASGWAAELAALTGMPAVSFPIARSASGIPVGLELLGRHNSDFDLLAMVDHLTASVV